MDKPAFVYDPKKHTFMRALWQKRSPGPEYCNRGIPGWFIADRETRRITCVDDKISLDATLKKHADECVLSLEKQALEDAKDLWDVLMECIEINYKHLFTDSAYKRDAVEAFKENMVSAETLKDYNEHTRVFLLALRRFMGVNFSHNTVDLLKHLNTIMEHDRTWVNSVMVFEFKMCHRNMMEPYKTTPPRYFTHFMKEYAFDDSATRNMAYLPPEHNASGAIHFNFHLDEVTTDDFFSENIQFGIVCLSKHHPIISGNKLKENEIIKYQNFGNRVYVKPSGVYEQVNGYPPRCILSADNSVEEKEKFDMLLEMDTLIDMTITNSFLIVHLSNRRLNKKKILCQFSVKFLGKNTLYGFVKFNTRKYMRISTTNKPVLLGKPSAKEQSLLRLKTLRQGWNQIVFEKYIMFSAEDEMMGTFRAWHGAQVLARQLKTDRIKKVVCEPLLPQNSRKRGRAFLMESENVQRKTVVLTNTYPARDLHHCSPVFFDCSTHFRDFVSQIGIAAKVCFDNKILHGDLYCRNCLWDTTVTPPIPSLIDFDRAEEIENKDWLGCAWISALSGYFFEMIHRGFNGGDPETMSDLMGKGSEMSQDVDRLQEAFVRATRPDNGFVFKVDKIYSTLYPGPKTLLCPKLVLNWPLVEKWCEPGISDKEKYDSDKSFYMSCGANYRISPMLLKSNGVGYRECNEFIEMLVRFSEH